MAYEIEALFAVYDYQNGERALDASYRLLYVFGNEGPVERELLEKVYCEIFMKEKVEGSSFESLMQLNQYAFELCTRLNAARICLLSVQEYNSALEKSLSVEEFKNNLTEFADCIENVDKGRKTGLLGKLFT